jgi:hypothetical protein
MPAGNTEFDLNTEIGLLQKMPGYAKLQTKMFASLMTADPDDSEDNTRNAYLKASGSDSGGDWESGSRGSRGVLKSAVSLAKKPDNQTSGVLSSRRKAGSTAQQESLSREIVKNVSQLILDKNAQKLRHMQAEQNEKAKRKYKPRPPVPVVMAMSATY